MCCQASQEGVYELEAAAQSGLLLEPPEVRFMATVIVREVSRFSMPSPAALSWLSAPFEDITDHELDPQPTLPHRVITWGEDFSPILTPTGRIPP